MVHPQVGWEAPGIFGDGLEPPQLPGVEHALVDDGLVAQAGDVEVAAPRDRRAGDLLLQQAPDYVQLPLERGLVGDVRPATDEDLADDRLARLRRTSQGGVVGGN